MKHLILSFLALLSCALASRAQTTDGPIVPLTERGYITTERSAYSLGDTLRVHGVVLSTDYTDFYPYSRYVNVELICPADDKNANADAVVVSQKVRTDAHGTFYATLPTDACRAEGRYYLRAYTRFMRNRPAETFPMTSVMLNFGTEKRHYEGGDWTVACYPEGGTLRAGIQQRMTVYVRDYYGNPVDGAELSAVCGDDTLAIADTRPSGYASLSFMPLAEGTQGKLIISRYGREMSVDLPTVAPAAPTLSTFSAGRKLRVQISGATEGLHLYAFQSGFGITEHPVGTGLLAIGTADIPDGLITFWLTDGRNVLCHRSVWVGRVGNEKPASLPDDAIAIRHVTSGTTPTLHAFESLCLLPQVRSEVPFPTTFYRENEREARTDLDLWLQTTRFIAFDIRDALAANFEYPYDPERALTLTGRAYNQQQKPLTYGSVEIVNLRTMTNYVCEVDAEGRYEQAVDDYRAGDQFFIESIDHIGKNRRYGASLEQPAPATMYNWLRLNDEANYDAGHRATSLDTQSSSLAGGIDLNEVTVTAQRVGRDWRTSQMDGLFFFDHDMLQDPIFRDLEGVLRRTGWVDIITGNSRPQATLRNQGSRFMANDYVSQSAGDDRVSGDRFCRWRNRRNLTLNPNGTDHMNILLDGVLITHSYDYLLSSTVDNYESIEIIGPNNSDSRLLSNYSPCGLIVLKSRHLMSKKDIPAKGITVQPEGLTRPLCPNTNAQLHPAPGQRLAVDIITPDRKIISWEE